MEQTREDLAVVFETQQRAPDLSLDQILIYSTSFLGSRFGAVALASRAQAMSRSVGLSRMRTGKRQIERYVVPLASRTSEGMRHGLNCVPDVVPGHTQAGRADFFVQEAVATCRGVPGSFLALHEPCRGHKTPCNCQGDQLREKVRATSRSFLYTTEHWARDRPDPTRTYEQKQLHHGDVSFEEDRGTAACGTKRPEKGTKNQT